MGETSDEQIEAGQEKKLSLQKTYLDVIRETNKGKNYITYRTIICGELGKDVDSNLSS